jgi:DNA sulfur modification protein DndD
MILKTLRVKNFRQIAGTFSMSFSPPGGRNVTVILGENGAGKSTLLNVFRWCLYGSIEMENPTELLSHFAVLQANVGEHVAVEADLSFEHNSVHYSILRMRQYEKLEGGDISPIGEEVCRVTKVSANGVTKSVDDPAGFVLNLLPENLSKFFFFQGESILQLALQRSAELLKEGVETFLEFKVLDRSIKHLKSVESDFEQELRLIANADVKAIQSSIDSIKEDLDQLEIQKDQVARNIIGNKSETDIRRLRLSEVEQFRPLFQEIAVQDSRLNELEQQRVDAVKELCSLISDNGFLAFSEKVLIEPRRLADEAVKKGELPAKIKPQFVTDLLQRGSCICGSTIDSAGRSALEKWRETTGLACLEDTIAALRQDVFNLNQYRKAQFRTAYPERRQKIAQIDDEVRAATEKRSKAERAVGNVSLDGIEIAKLQEAYEQLKNKYADLRVEESRVVDKIESRKKDLEAFEKQRKEVSKTLLKERIISRRIDASKNVRKSLEQVRMDWSHFVQEYLDQRLKKSWNEVAQLPRRVSFNKDFSLSIEERGGAGNWVTSAPSEANCAVLALTFVCALIRFAKQISQDKDRGAFFSGGDFPLVMDAPFAKMDTEFKQKVPKGVTNTVPQVVIISSLDQWEGEVEESLGGAVGRGYVLALHKPGEESKIRQVKAFGRTVDYVITDENITTDWTEIQEVTL